jgi:hypothetical protein
MATRRLLAGACLGALIASCGRADEPDGAAKTESPQVTMLRFEAAVAARDRQAYDVAVGAILRARSGRQELLVLLTDSLERDQREGRIWPGKTFPSAEVLVRFGRAGVRPLVQTASTAIAQEQLDLGGVPDREMMLPWTFNREQEAELLALVLSRGEDLADRVTAATMLGALSRPWAPATLRALLAFCDRDDVEAGEEAHVGTCVARALIRCADRDLDGFLAALPQAPVCGKIYALSFLDDPDFVRAAQGNPALLRTVDKFLADPDPRVAASTAVTSTESPMSGTPPPARSPTGRRRWSGWTRRSGDSSGPRTIDPSHRRPTPPASDGSRSSPLRRQRRRPGEAPPPLPTARPRSPLCNRSG